MALTTEGQTLTDRHRRKQIALATAADSQIRRAWQLIDIENIDASRGAWERRMTAIIVQHHKVSEIQAARYLDRYRLAELGSRTGPTVTPGLDIASALDRIDAAGPQGLKHRIRQGTEPYIALTAARDSVQRTTRKLILSGGRGVVRESGRADQRAIGWRRKSDRDPCTFCAMLVSRGPAYMSDATALSNPNADPAWLSATGAPDPYHNNCACTVEIVYGDWIPNEAEQQWVDAYQEAAEQATAEDGKRTAETVLHRMRDNGTFRDSPARRAIEAAAL